MGAKLGLVKEQDASVDSYVTRKALDGLFTVIVNSRAPLAPESRVSESPVSGWPPWESSASESPAWEPAAEAGRPSS